MQNLILILLALFTSSALAQTTVSVDVGEAKSRKSLIALPLFNNYGSDSSAETLKAAQELYNVVLNDLEVTGFFTFIKPVAYLEDTNKLALRPSPLAPNGFDYVFVCWKIWRKQPFHLFVI